MEVSSKINGIDGNRAAPVGPGRGVERAKDAAAGGKESAGDSSDSVDITGTARQLAALEHALATQPAVDEALVTSIRTAIEQGRYAISPDRIADQLVQLERALGHLES